MRPRCFVVGAGPVGEDVVEEWEKGGRPVERGMAVG